MALTKVSGGILDPGINVAGIVTATGFDGPFTGGSSKNITAGIITATELDVNGNGDISGNLVIGGNLTANGDFTTLNTTLREVEILRVDANTTATAGIITQRGSGDILNLYDGTTEVFSVSDGGNLTLGGGKIYGDDNGFNVLTLQSTSGNNNHSRIDISVNESDNGGIHFYTAGSSVAERRITIKGTSGNVGIGTVTPQTILHLHDSTNTRIQITDNGTGAESGDGVIAGLNGEDDFFINNRESGKGIKFFTGTDDERMVINSDGDIGIGGTVPARRLSIFDTAACVLELNSTNSGGTSLRIQHNHADKMLLGLAGDFIVGQGSNVTDSAIRNEGALIIATGGGNEKVRIDSDGNIFLKDAAGQGNSLVHYIRANDSSGNSQYQLGMVSSGNEDLYLIQSRNANLRFQTSGSSRWLIDGDPGHLLPAVAGAVNIGSASAEIGDIYFANSKGLKLGNSQVGDLYNDGTDTYFRNSVSNGQTLIRSGGNIWISDYSGNHRAAFRDNSSVDLYFDIENNATAKLSTTVKGISVHGEVAASQDYPNIQPTLDLNFAAVKKLDPRITFYRTTTGSYIDENGDYRWASANEPRFDHDEVTHESKGLLMEVARTNKLSSGNNIPSGSNSGGSPGPSLVANNVEAPDGSFTARTIDYSNASSNMNSANIEFGGWDSDPSGKTYSASIWVKGIAGQHINFYLDASGQGSSNTGKGNFTLTGKWQRLSVYHTYPAGSNAAYLRCGSRNLQTGVEGTATVTSFWGTTIVEESQPGSTIATPIVPVTTTPDYALIDGEAFSEFYSPLEHTTVMIGQRASNVAGADGRLYTISDGSSSQVAPDWDFDDGTKLRFSTNVGGSTQTLQRIESWSGINDEFKIAAGIALNNQIGVVNGTAIAAADTSCAIPTGVDRLYFGLRGDGGNQGSLTIKRFIFYPKRLPDSQLVTLTS